MVSRRSTALLFVPVSSAFCALAQCQQASQARGGSVVFSSLAPVVRPGSQPTDQVSRNTHHLKSAALSFSIFTIRRVSDDVIHDQIDRLCSVAAKDVQAFKLLRSTSETLKATLPAKPSTLNGPSSQRA